MGRKTKDSFAKSKLGCTKSTEDFIWVDPAWIRFQHARIRPKFSSCGRTLLDTLNSIRSGDITPFDLPPIQVLVGPETENGKWYFSLNNRRLWVLKRCREEGLLSSSNNQIPVRVRAPKSQLEVERYTLEKCSLEAKVIREKSNTRVAVKDATHPREAVSCHEDSLGDSDDVLEGNPSQSADIDESDEDCDDDDEQAELFTGDCSQNRNRFSDLSL